jgi:cell wall-associated NlpC family hydrolase
MTGEEFIAGSRAWLGVPFRHQGRSRFGVDCIGFPIARLREEGLLPAGFEDRHAYGRVPDGTMLPIVSRWCQAIVRLEVGCLILIRWPRFASPSHAALFTGRSMLHAYQRAGGVVENGYRGPWVKHFHSAWRLPGIGCRHV